MDGPLQKTADTKFDLIRSLIAEIGDDPEREGVRDTPRRVIDSWEELFGGYRYSEAQVGAMLTQFDGEDYDEIVLLKNIEFYSMCEHHILPFVGIAHVAYIPNGKVVGISKLARTVEVYSRRLQNQERICKQVTLALMTHLQPKGAACILDAKHLCMCARGVSKQQSSMVTSYMQGAFRQDAARAELFSLIKE